MDTRDIINEINGPDSKEKEDNPVFKFGEGFKPLKQQKFEPSFEELPKLKQDEFGWYFEADYYISKSRMVAREKNSDVLIVDENLLSRPSLK
ncbi:MAG: hypothetical protein JO131_10140 [Gammaproteobacteria bacterium]|nr:hypothetical protein [Gammaproteobacteria bacterium]